MFRSPSKHHVLECYSKEATHKIEKGMLKQKFKESLQKQKTNEQVKK
jgi:predicted nucleic acid-binding protein